MVQAPYHTDGRSAGGADRLGHQSSGDAYVYLGDQGLCADLPDSTAGITYNDLQMGNTADAGLYAAGDKPSGAGAGDRSPEPDMEPGQLKDMISVETPPREPVSAISASRAKIPNRPKKSPMGETLSVSKLRRSWTPMRSTRWRRETLPTSPHRPASPGTLLLAPF